MQSLHDQIIHHMARTLFALAYADWAEEVGESLPGDVFNHIPSTFTDVGALAAAQWFGVELMAANGFKVLTDLSGVFYLAKHEHLFHNEKGDREMNPEHFAHYTVMQAIGHGVGLRDAFGLEVSERISVPYLQFNWCDLAGDYFLKPGEDEQEDEPSEVPALTNVSSRGGAPMGRPSHIAVDDPLTFKGPVHIVRLRMVDGDYDTGGAYWGGPGHTGRMYRAYYWNPDNEEQMDHFIRANGLTDALRQLRVELPEVELIGE